MTDPLSLAASIVAIAGAAETALRVSKALRDAARTIKEAADDIESFSIDVLSFAQIVQLGHDSLKRHQRRNPSSHVLQYIESHNLIEQLAKQSERTKSRLEKAWKSTDNMESSVKLVTKFRWMLKKGDIQGLKPEMESLKTSLQVVMSSIMMELLHQKEDSEDVREEITALKSQIKLHLETIEFLQNIAQKHQAQAESALETEKSLVSFFSLDQDAQTALVGLGTSMVENEKVPDEFETKQRKASYSTDDMGVYHSVESSASLVLPSITAETQQREVYKINPSVMCKKLSGFMNMVSKDHNHSHWKPQVAILFDKTPANIMSTALVDLFGASAPPIKKTEVDIWINFGFEECQVIGTIKFFWRSSLKEQNNSRQLTCLVYKSSYQVIIFGKWARSLSDSGLSGQVSP